MDPSPKCVVRGLRQEELALEKDAAAPCAQTPGGLSRISRGAPRILARFSLRPQEYLQPSDPGWERLGKARQPLATAVQQLPKAAAGSGARELRGDTTAGVLGRACAPQHGAQQQP